MAVASEALELREIRGPSAFGGGWRRIWDLLWLISVTEFRVNYRNTALGYAWSVIKPFVFFGTIYLVVNEVLRFGSHSDNFPLALILNLVLFQYFTEATSQAVRAISARESMVRKMQFPRIVIPLTINMSAAINMFFNLIGDLPALPDRRPRSALELAAVAGRARSLIVLTTTLSMLLAVAFVALSRRRARLAADRPGALLRDPDPLPDQHPAGQDAVDHRRQSACHPVLTGSDLDRRPERADQRRAGRGVDGPGGSAGDHRVDLRLRGVAVRSRRPASRRSPLDD